MSHISSTLTDLRSRLTNAAPSPREDPVTMAILFIVVLFSVGVHKRPPLWSGLSSFLGISIARHISVGIKQFAVLVKFQFPSVAQFNLCTVPVFTDFHYFGIFVFRCNKLFDGGG